MDMGCAGNHEIITPNLDKMAQEGFQFMNAVSCYPVCTPQRASMITGRFPTTIDVLFNDLPLPLDGKGFGYELKNGNYKTAYIGKWHLFGPEPYRTTYIPEGEHRQGFDYWAVLNCGHRYLKSFYYLNNNPEKIMIDEYEPDAQTDLAIEYIKKHKDEPFSLFLSWGPPHDPFDQVPEKWKDMYDKDKLTFRPNVMAPVLIEREGFRSTFINKGKSDGKSMSYTGNPDKVMLRDYYAAITALDHNIGKINNCLSELGIEENTIVVFTSDHGEMMFSHGFKGKLQPWEESINVPFIIKYPAQIPPSAKSNVPFNTVDILPTVLGLMSLKVPGYVQGIDISDHLRGLDCKTPEAAYIMCAVDWVLPEWRGVRTNRYTYVKSKEETLMLYDNINDPYQMNNLAGNSEVEEIQKELEIITDSIGREIGDKFEPWSEGIIRMKVKNSEWTRKYGNDLNICKETWC
jgi:arylsulfatase A-like enzyme